MSGNPLDVELKQLRKASEISNAGSMTQLPLSARTIPTMQMSGLHRSQSMMLHPSSAAAAAPAIKSPGVRRTPIGLSGPYINDHGRLHAPRTASHSRSASPRPQLLQQHHHSAAASYVSLEDIVRRADESALCDQGNERPATAAADQEREKIDDEEGKNAGNAQHGSGIEVIKLVKKSNLSQQSQTDRKKENNEGKKAASAATPKHFASVAEKIMHARIEVERQEAEDAQRRSARLPRSKSYNNGFFREDRKQERSAIPRSAGGRPESVAQRVMRERQMRNITIIEGDGKRTTRRASKTTDDLEDNVAPLKLHESLKRVAGNKKMHC